jgi:hypothetical protein
MDNGGRSLDPEERAFPASRGRAVPGHRPDVVPRDRLHITTRAITMTLWLLMYTGRLAHARTFSRIRAIPGARPPRVMDGRPRRKRLVRAGEGG